MCMPAVCQSLISGYEEENQYLLVEAIHIQRELKHCGAEPIATDPCDRMFPKQYASPLQMLRRTENQPIALSSELLNTWGGTTRQDRKECYCQPKLLSANYCRVEPYCNNKVARPQLPSAFRRKGSLFPSIAARLENDVALGLAASLWPSGNVVGHCDDRLAHLLVLSSTIVRCKKIAQRDCEKLGGVAAARGVSSELRCEYMKAIEHLVYLERSVTETILLVPPNLGVSQERLPCRGGAALQDSVAKSHTSKGTSVELSVSILSAVRVLKGLIEPATLTDRATSNPTWQYSLVRTAADVPSRYDIVDAMSYTLEPYPGLAVPRIYCAVARQLALEILRSAGNGSIGDRAAVAALRILQHINTRTECLCSEEREAGQLFLSRLQWRLQRLTQMLASEVVDEATLPTRELVAATRMFCGDPPVDFS